ncbi:MAG: pyrroline-5-carboxylate reductase [Micrococcales bacterium]|nr:MAG: pyrroline-5-carboxylate reductase [Micrococcales bacterium]PIE25936.1 MAG: pyrroline-5-carboxylate reductase [Micrococcales bacterium]
MHDTTRVALLGAGVMGETLLSGLLRAGWSRDNLVITERREDRVRELRTRYAVDVLGNAEAAQLADTLVLVVKPQDMDALLSELAPVVRPDHLVICIAAGISTDYVQQRLGAGVSVVRVMPNTPALVDQGMTAISAGAGVSAAQLQRASDILSSTGKVVQVAERHQDAVTALSGSGPAYIFFVVESMIEAGVLLGLPRATATELAIQTVYGAATMLAETGTHPSILREQVSSPAGTTVAALRELENHKVRAAFLAAMEAAKNRSVELSSGTA